MKLLKIVILILVFIEAVFLVIYLHSEQKKGRTPVPSASPVSSPLALSSPSLAPESSPSAEPSEISPSPEHSIEATPSTGMSPAPYPTLSPDEGDNKGEAADFAKGLKHYNKMDYDKAITCFKEIVGVNPKNVWAHYYLFLSYVQIEANAWSKDSNAYREARTLISLNPDKSIQDSVDSYLGDVRKHEQDDTTPPPSAAPSPVAVKKTATPAVPPSLGGTSGVPTKTSKDADEHYEKGRNYDRNGNYTFAVAEYSNAIKFNPGHIDSYISRGSLYESKAEYGPAMADYSKAIELKPGDSRNYYRRGKLYKTMKDNEKAKADLLKVKELDPSMNDKVDLLLKEIDGQ